VTILVYFETVKNKNTTDYNKKHLSQEKLLQFGAQCLTLRELWSSILKPGHAKNSDTTNADCIVNMLHQHNFPDSLSPQQLSALSAKLQSAQLSQVLAIVELFHRITQYQGRTFHSPSDISLLAPELAGAVHEQVMCFYLSGHARILHQQTLAMGNWNTTLISPKEIFQVVRFYPVESIILVHNHPSGVLMPSQEDKAFTQRMQSAGRILGIQLTDHIIVSRKGYFSFREAGLL
jgi:DNA repair protein RadC